MNQNHKKRKLFFISILIAGIFGVSAIIMLLWNWLLTTIFNFPCINIWQSMGLFVLCRLLFGGFPSPKRPNRNMPFRNSDFKDKFMSMNDDEKCNFKEEWKKRNQ